MFVYVADGVRPPERLTVSEAAERYRILYNPGSYSGPWNNSITPYLVEFMDTFTDEDKTGAVFVGPAQSGKSDCVLNWLTYSVVCDPADMMIVDKTQPSAREFSILKLNRLHDHSPAVRERLRPGRNNDNTFDRRYRSGMVCTITWPTKNNLSGKSIPRVWLADYDRMPPDVDGEGAPFWLAMKRTTTFGRFAMTVAESSPSFPVDLVRWKKKSLHEAPPSGGILSLYNQGDRRRWYWRCVKCGHPFEPDFSNMHWPDSEDIREAAEGAHLACPNCLTKYFDDDTDTPGKHRMNREHARWIADGQTWLPNGEVKGEPERSKIASFWLKGPAATFVTMRGIVEDVLKAERVFEQTGREEDLQTVYNTTLALPYIPKHDQLSRLPEDLKARAESVPERTVPKGVRFLVAAIDLQKNRFVVQVMGVGAAEHGAPDWWVIDRFDIRKSRRFDDDGERYWVNLGTHPEDWRQLTDEVIKRSYPLADGSGREMMIKSTVSDAAGQKGFTENAYLFYRWLRTGPNDDYVDDNGKPIYFWEPGLHNRFHLLRGAPTASGPRVKLTWPDSQRMDKFAAARGDIPVWVVNTQVLKDSLDQALDRREPGGMVHFPDWLPMWFFKELTVEVKDPRKGWQKPNSKARNEAWDLMVYARAATLMPDIDIERIDWDNPPGWAEEWDKNDLVFSPELQDDPFHDREESDDTLEKLGELLG